MIVSSFANGGIIRPGAGRFGWGSMRTT